MNDDRTCIYEQIKEMTTESHNYTIVFEIYKILHLIHCSCKGLCVGNFEMRAGLCYRCVINKLYR